jgi:copper oxidase (laccase) domain-containing protein
LQVRDFPLESFPALDSASCRYAFIGRVSGIEVSNDKAEVLSRLDAVHHGVRTSLGLDQLAFLTAEQVHGNRVAVIDAPIESDHCFAGCDGLITNQPGVCLGIYVADCCAIYLVDPVQGAIGLVHSGRKGTELGIISEAITGLIGKCESNPDDLIVQLSPCIRPPHYEEDFAAEIVRQCHALGVEKVYDCGICTACDLERYYSYRAEKGRTGRMLALLALG